MKTYHLFKSETEEKYLLAIHQREEVNNSDESTLEIALNNEQSSVTQCAMKHLVNPIKVGVMEDFPIGDELFECNNGDYVDLWVAKNTLDSNFLILGSAQSAAIFQSEAREEYQEMVGELVQSNHLRVLIHNAI